MDKKLVLSYSILKKTQKKYIKNEKSGVFLGASVR